MNQFRGKSAGNVPEVEGRLAGNRPSFDLLSEQRAKRAKWQLMGGGLACGGDPKANDG